MVSERRLDLSAVREELDAIFQKYPAGNLCDVCAREVGTALRKAGFDVAIVTIQNEETPGAPSVRPPYLQATKPDGQSFLLAETGFHQTNRIRAEEVSYYIDVLVYMHFGVEAIDESTYFSLFVYPDGLEITGVQRVM